MYHPSETGQFWPESHYPVVKIFRKSQIIQITLYVSSDLHQKFQNADLGNWTYNAQENGAWISYPFLFTAQLKSEESINEIRAFNTLLNFCYSWGYDENFTTDDSTKAQLALMYGANPIEFRMAAYGLEANFASPVTEALKSIPSSHALEQYVTSRMRGAYKILLPQGSKLLRPDNEMHLYQSGNPLPILRTPGSCACFSVESNALDHSGGFLLSPHNIDSHHQQFLLMIGTLVFWQRMRKIIQAAR